VLYGRHPVSKSRAFFRRRGVRKPLGLEKSSVRSTTFVRTPSAFEMPCIVVLYGRPLVLKSRASDRRRSVVSYGRFRVSNSQSLVRPRVIVLYRRRLLSTDARADAICFRNVVRHFDVAEWCRTNAIWFRTFERPIWIAT